MQNIGSTIVQILSFALIARIISQTDLGILAALTLTLSFFYMVTNLGLPAMVAKFIAEFTGKKDWEGASSVFYQTLRINIILSVAAGLFCFVFSDLISSFLLKSFEYSILFKVLAADIIVYGLYQSFLYGLSGLQKFKEMSIFNLIRLCLRQSLVVVTLLLGYGLLGVVVAWFVGDLLNCLMFGILAVRSFGTPIFDFNMKRLFRSSYPLYLSSVLSFAYGWFDQALLLAFLSLDDLGTYSVVLKPFSVLTGFTEGISIALFPKYSELHGRNGVGSMEKAIYGASRYICYIIMPLAFGLTAIAAPALTIFVGPSYLSATQPLMILSFFFGVTCIQAAFGGIFLVLEKTWISSALNIFNVVLGTVLGLFLSRLFGINGIAAARGVTLLLTLFLYLWVLRRKINLRLDGEAFWKSLISSATMAMTLFLVQSLWYNAYLLPLYLLIGLLAYAIMLKITRALRKVDVELIKNYAGRRLELLAKPFELFLTGE